MLLTKRDARLLSLSLSLSLCTISVLLLLLLQFLLRILLLMPPLLPLLLLLLCSRSDAVGEKACLAPNGRRSASVFAATELHLVTLDKKVAARLFPNLDGELLPAG